MVTIADVARHAGVAPSTVFYVLTGKRSISAETRTRVHDSIAELGYRPLAGAQAGRRDPVDVLALVLPAREVQLPVVTRLITSVAAAARRHDMNVLLLTEDRRAAGLRRAADSTRVNGFLVLDAKGAGERVAMLTELGRPTVLIGQRRAGVTCVDLDHEAAGARCVNHLADLGHRSIGFLGAPSAQRTLAGFSAAAMHRGVVGTALPVEAGPESVVRTTNALLRAHPEITALVVHDESVLHRLVDCVPPGIAVVAICQDEPAEQLSLTAVELSAEELGRRAADLLVALIGGATPPPLTLVPPRLVQRTSLPAPRTEVVSISRAGRRAR